MLGDSIRRVVREEIERVFDPVSLGTDPDPGLFGPGSMTWNVHGDPSVFLGAVRSLLLQSLHPEVVAGVDQHSTYGIDPLGRLRRTSDWVTVVTFAPSPDAVAAATALERYHAHIRGVSERGRAYTASDPPLLSWVHNTMVDSFLEAYRRFGPGCADADADAYVSEMAALGALCGADELPATAGELRAWITGHPDASPSAAGDRAHRFLADPPLRGGTRLFYEVLLHGALASVPPPLDAWCPSPAPGAGCAARVAMKGFSVVLGKSTRVQEATQRTEFWAPSRSEAEQAPESGRTPGPSRP
jgi:hypothetical protein